MLSRLKFEISNLVNEMLNQIPDEIWESENKTFIDLAMGGGQFVKEIERRLREKGHSNENITNRVFGMEKNKLRVNYAINKHGLIGKYWVGNHESEIDMKFDVVVGNPPYQSEKRTGTQPLWPLFVKKGYELLTDTGYLAMITPNKWCGHTANIIKGNIRLYKDVFKYKLVYANIQECSRYFQGVGGYENCFSYFVINKSGSEKSTIRTMEDNFVIGNDMFEYLPLRNLDYNTANILKKVKTNQNYNFKQVSTGFKNSGSKRIVVSMAQRLHYSKLNTYLDDDAHLPATSKSTVSSLQFPNSSQELVDKVFKSKLFSFLHYIFWNGDNFSTTFYNNLPYVDLSRLWSDEELYKHFNLTNEEIRYIEENIT